MRRPPLFCFRYALRGWPEAVPRRRDGWAAVAGGAAMTLDRWGRLPTMCRNLIAQNLDAIEPVLFKSAALKQRVLAMRSGGELIVVDSLLARGVDALGQRCDRE